MIFLTNISFLFVNFHVWCCEGFLNKVDLTLREHNVDTGLAWDKHIKPLLRFQLSPSTSSSKREERNAKV